MGGRIGFGVLALVVGIAGCDGGEVSDIGYDAVRTAKSAEAGALEAWLATAKGKSVRWTGRVVRAQRVRGDDFVEEGILYVDMDGGEAGGEAPDVVMDIPVGDVDGLAPGQTVTYVATVRELESGDEGPLLRLQLKSFE